MTHATATPAPDLTAPDLTAPGAADIAGRPSRGAALSKDMLQAEARREKSRDLKPLTNLFPYVAAHRGTALAALVFLLISTSATLSLSVAARLVIDHGFNAETGKALNLYFLGGLGVSVVLAAASGCRFYFVNRLGERVVADLRQRIYAHVLGLDQAYFLHMRTGEVLSRLTTDTAIVETMVGINTSIALRNLLVMLGSLAIMAAISIKLTLAVLLVVPAILVPLILFGRRVRRLSTTAQDRFAEAVGYAGETLDQLDTVQAFGREQRAASQFAEAVETAFSASLQRLRARGMLTIGVMSFVFGSVVGVLWLGAQFVRSHEMTGGALLQFIFLAVLAASAVNALQEVWSEVQKTAGAMHRIGEILASRAAIAPPAHPRPLPAPVRGALAFQDVVFHYPARPELPALNGFTLQVRPGETVALVGPSGAGKSTVLRLLLRFYDPQRGAVSLDGVDLREADPAEVRAHMALVAQDAALFSGSALDNIRFGRPDADEAEVRQAARAAQAEAFVEALPGGFSARLGERGRTLSGGQRQRLAIARALVRDAPVLLLDEATSALDAENERLVQRALEAAMRARTTLVIAHRLSTVLRADRIVVMDEGRVVEEGRHAELLAQGGLYARLARLQFDVQAA
jgi:ATP-binding cassette subfamily B protein